jgi:hypothetical protein
MALYNSVSNQEINAVQTSLTSPLFIEVPIPIQESEQKFVLNAHISTKVVSSNPVHCEVYSIQHYVIKFVSDLRQVGGFLWLLRFPAPIKLTVTI